MNKRPRLGEFLRKERAFLKMSQNDFAKYLNMSSSTYERVENDRLHDIKLEYMLNILKKTDIPIDIFIPIEILNRFCIYVIPKKT